MAEQVGGKGEEYHFQDLSTYIRRKLNTEDLCSLLSSFLLLYPYIFSSFLFSLQSCPHLVMYMLLRENERDQWVQVFVQGAKIHFAIPHNIYRMSGGTMTMKTNKHFVFLNQL